MNVALRPENLNIISLCTGGGGLDLGVELAMPGARSIVLVEREAFAVGHLVAAMQQGLLGEAPIWSDVTTFDGRPWRGLVDGLIGGIPCQPHSLAGKRLGEEDERDLWSDARRIFVQSGAWFILIENVRGMLSSGGAERVWRDLQRLGCSVEVGLFTAAEVGASHERERVFILAVADSIFRIPNGGRPGQVQGSRSAPEGEARLREWSRHDFGYRFADVAHASGARLQRGKRAGAPSERDRTTAHGSTPKLCGASLGYADEFGECQPNHADGTEPRQDAWDHSGRSSGRSVPPMVNAVSSRYDGGAHGAIGGSIQRTTPEGPSPSGLGSMDDAPIARDGRLSVQPGRSLETSPYSDRTSLFPPGPSDLSRWRLTLERSPELEPAFRRVADGLASRLDTARVDRLRMLGNGVVSLQAAYALRTLATRLAAGGSAGAARLVRGMELIA